MGGRACSKTTGRTLDYFNISAYIIYIIQGFLSCSAWISYVYPQDVRIDKINIKATVEMIDPSSVRLTIDTPPLFMYQDLFDVALAISTWRARLGCLRNIFCVTAFPQFRTSTLPHMPQCILCGTERNLGVYLLVFCLIWQIKSYCSESTMSLSIFYRPSVCLLGWANQRFKPSGVGMVA